jgi:hypothetical protein
LFLQGYIDIPIPENRGDISEATGMPTEVTGLSRTHLQGAGGSFTVQLDSEPLSPVTVSILYSNAKDSLWAWSEQGGLNSDAKDITLAQYHWQRRAHQASTNLVFNATTWNIPKVVNVGAVDNNVAGQYRTRMITLNASSEDKTAMVEEHVVATDSFSSKVTQIDNSKVYHQVDRYHTHVGKEMVWPFKLNKTWSSLDGKIKVQITDDDRAGISLSTSRLVITEGKNPNASLPLVAKEEMVWKGNYKNGKLAPGYAHFKLNLDSEPTHPVTIQIHPQLKQICSSLGSCSSLVQMNATPPTLTFTAQTWNQPKNVILSATDDNVFEGEIAYDHVYTKFIRQNETLLVRFNSLSSDSSFANIPVGTNELTLNKTVDGVIYPNGEPYPRTNGIEVTVIDDDAGCPYEYTCNGHGSCVENLRHSRCECDFGYGGRDCSLKCLVPGEPCAFSRGYFIVEIGALNVFSPVAFTQTLSKRLQETHGLSTNDMYVINHKKVQCLFSEKSDCRLVEIDFTGKGHLVVLRELMDLERNMSFFNAPYSIKLAGQTVTQKFVYYVKYAVWSFVGGIFAVCFALFVHVLQSWWQSHKENKSALAQALVLAEQRRKLAEQEKLRRREWEKTNPPPFQEKSNFDAVLTVTLFSAQGLPNVDIIGKSDPYVKIDFLRTNEKESSIKSWKNWTDKLGRNLPMFPTKVRSETIDNTLNPEWNCSYSFLLQHFDKLGKRGHIKRGIERMRVQLYDEDVLNDELMGQVMIKLKQGRERVRDYAFEECKGTVRIGYKITRLSEAILKTDEPGKVKCPFVKYDQYRSLTGLFNHNSLPAYNTLFSVGVVCGSKLEPGSLLDKSDPYGVVRFPDNAHTYPVARKTKVMRNDLNPRWLETMVFIARANPNEEDEEDDKAAEKFRFDIFDYDGGEDDENLGGVNLIMQTMTGKQALDKKGNAWLQLRKVPMENLLCDEAFVHQRHTKMPGQVEEKEDPGKAHQRRTILQRGNSTKASATRQTMLAQ